MHMRMRTAVGIATVGRPAVLAETLRELGRQTRLPDRIVVCGTSPADVGDASAWAQPAEVVLAPRGLPCQRNRILEVTADCDILLFLDDDFLPDPHYIENVEQIFLERPDAAMATGRVLADGIGGPGLTPSEGRAILAADDFAGDRLQTAPAFNGYGCNMAVRSAVVRRHRLRFDERLPLYAWQEDVDFSRRLAPHGAILQLEGARGVHLGVKQGRSPGVQLGYAQVVNPFYLVRKQAGYPMGRALSHVGCNMAANLLRALRPEPWVDRRGRLRGNLQALADLLRGGGRSVVSLRGRSERPPIPAAAHNPSWRQAGPALAPRQVPLALDAHADTEPLAALSPALGAAMLAGSTGSIPDQGVP